MYRIGFIGGGNMAEAIVRGGVGAGLIDAGDVIVADPSDARRAVFAQLGAAVSDANAEVIRQSEHVVLAVKPQVFQALAGELAEHLDGKQVLISVMAGVRTGRIAEAIEAAGGQGPYRIVRVMPNTPALVGAGMAGIALGAAAAADDAALARQLFEAVGEAVMVEEAKLDAITAVSGSGPAYLFYLAEAMEEAAAELGLKDEAALLVGQTLHGAVKLLGASAEDAAALRRKVMSPGGTTEAAINHMETREVRQSVREAIAAAAQRSRELGE